MDKEEKKDDKEAKKEKKVQRKGKVHGDPIVELNAL